MRCQSIAGAGASAVEREAVSVRRRCRAEVLAVLAGGAGAELESSEALACRIEEARPRSWLRIVPGRRTFLWPHDPDVVVKVYGEQRPLGALRELAAGRPARTPGRREAENLRELASDGFPVPRALGWCEQVASPLKRAVFSAVWMRRIEHGATLRQLAERDARSAFATWSDELASLVSRLHARGWYHRDLYLEHWIVADGRLVLLDVGRARRERRARERWFVKDVAALLHSCPAGVSPRARLRFLARYLDGRGIGERGRRRQFARAVLAKARRIAAHEPRHVDRTSRAP